MNRKDAKDTKEEEKKIGNLVVERESLKYLGLVAREQIGVGFNPAPFF
jgi:hypothetical protein